VTLRPWDTYKLCLFKSVALSECPLALTGMSVRMSVCVCVCACVRVCVCASVCVCVHGSALRCILDERSLRGQAVSVCVCVCVKVLAFWGWVESDCQNGVLGCGAFGGGLKGWGVWIRTL